MLTIEDATYLQISKAGRKVYCYARARLASFGRDNYDLVRIEAKGKFPTAVFDKAEYYFPVFQATGKLIGRQVTEIEIEIFRNRPKWLDKKESEGIIRLAPIIPEQIALLDETEQVRLKSCDNQPRGSLLVHLHYTQHKYL